jgi:Uma2 family endonuclease
MSSIQPIRPDLLRRHRLTVDDYYKMGEAGIFKDKDRVELIEGEIIDMVPIGSQHAYILNKLNRIFSKQITDEILIRLQDPLRLDQYNEPEPDLALVANKNYSAHHPGPTDTLLVIEVADSSLAYDIDIKTPLYARHGIPEIWVVNLIDKKIHVFDNPTNGMYQNTKEITAGRLSPAHVASFILDLEELW